MSIFAFVFLTACKDPSSLVGDSNIYANPIELELEAISFEEKMSADSDMPQEEEGDIPVISPRQTQSSAQWSGTRKRASNGSLHHRAD